MPLRFDDLGMTFVLFEAPVEAACVQKNGTCAHCGREAQFLLDGGCYDCLRAGKVERAIETELGLVCREDAAEGVTLGAPTDLPSCYAVVPHPSAPDCDGVRLPIEELRELVRTPKYSSWQGERWLFCCGRAQVFIGDFPLDTISERAAGDSESALSLLADAFGEPLGRCEALRERIASDAISTYTFRCRTCGRLRAYWDSD